MPKQKPVTVDAKRLRIALPLVAVLSALGLYLTGLNGGNLYSRLLSMQLPLPAQQYVQVAPEPTPEAYIPSADIDVGVSDSFRVELLNVSDQDDIDLAGDEPRILIYHTHTTEAYRQVGGEKYAESGRWRTHDPEHSIVAVGELLAKTLREKYGFNVIHDTTDHEPPKLATSYSRSIKTMEEYKKKYPSITMFIDMHRDAYGTSDSGKEDFVTIGGKQVARLMFVVGTGEGATGTGFGKMPDFQSNYALAKRITEYLAGIDPGLVRKIRVKTGRYNQHISNQCLLVEVGHNANTLSQAKNAMPYLADAIAHTAGMQPAKAPVLQLSP
ncbi:MAG: stage II sporulation protein P [Clostridia bacterium]